MKNNIKDLLVKQLASRGNHDRAALEALVKSRVNAENRKNINKIVSFYEKKFGCKKAIENFDILTVEMEDVLGLSSKTIPHTGKVLFRGSKIADIKDISEITHKSVFQKEYAISAFSDNGDIVLSEDLDNAYEGIFYINKGRYFVKLFNNVSIYG